jgi:pimeloyl-ACP methyl ester carboxylesterase
MVQTKKNPYTKATILITTFALLTTTTIGIQVATNSARAQTPCDNGAITHSNTTIRPVILVHGYFEDSSIWSEWERLLKADGIPFCTVTFHNSDDSCGSAADHAQELAQIVKQVKSMTGQSQVNIVGHSKGGLDARVYLANNLGSSDVANLIMIGTPNAGTVAADVDAGFGSLDWCIPAKYDLTTLASAIRARQNIHTNYYTIAGDCLSIYSGVIPGPDDGIVPVSSVESLSYATSLGHTHDCHWILFGNAEFRLAEPILTSG